MNATVTRLTEMGGNYWEKGSMQRVYFNAEAILKLAGYEYTTYNTGNISSARLNGEGISNSEMRRVTSVLNLGKFYFDVTTSKFMQNGTSTAWTDAVRKLRAAISVEVA